MYVALTRGTDLDMVHFDYTPKLFMKARATKESFTLKVKPNHEFLHGKIYKILPKDESWIYVGHTIQTLKERMDEHIQKPSNKEMAKLLNDKNVKIHLIEYAPCITLEGLQRIEDKYIQKFSHGQKSL
jgi:hypothetical protein